MKTLTLAFVACVLLSACTTGVSSFPARESEVMESLLVPKIKIVDYDTDLSKKIEGSSSGIISKSSSLNFHKEQAVINACATSGVDFLINPTYTVTSKANVVTVVVKGYGAKYTNIRDAAPADSLHLKYSTRSTNPSNRSQPASNPRIKLIY